MDLSVQALRVEAKRVNTRNRSVILSALSACCLAQKACYLRTLQFKKQVLCTTLEISQAPISAGSGHAIVVSPAQDTRPQLSRCSDLFCSFLGMDLISIHYKKRFTLGGKRSWGDFSFFQPVLFFYLLWRLEFKSWSRGDIVGRTEWKMCTVIKMQPDVSSTCGRALLMCCTPQGTVDCLLKVFLVFPHAEILALFVYLVRLPPKLN